MPSHTVTDLKKFLSDVCNRRPTQHSRVRSAHSVSAQCVGPRRFYWFVRCLTLVFYLNVAPPGVARQSVGGGKIDTKFTFLLCFAGCSARKKCSNFVPSRPQGQGRASVSKMGLSENPHPFAGGVLLMGA